MSNILPVLCMAGAASLGCGVPFRRGKGDVGCARNVLHRPLSPLSLSWSRVLQVPCLQLVHLCMTSDPTGVGITSYS